MEKWLLLGASRGLGKAFAEVSRQSPRSLEIEIVSRKSDWSMDFSKKEKWAEYFQQISNKNPQRIFYFAGGGPWGSFAQKNWQDHEWAFKVNFEFPAFLLHSLAKQPEQLKQFFFIGSKIAENQPDPNASSYAASKHALRGLITSIQAEKSLPFDIQLFSPGYMDTDLLPQNAWPRQNPELIQNPAEVARHLFSLVD